MTTSNGSKGRPFNISLTASAFIVSAFREGLLLPASKSNYITVADVFEWCKCLPRQAKQPPNNCRQRVAESGAEGDRTLNLLDANQALSQLSYGPETRLPQYTRRFPLRKVPPVMVDYRPSLGENQASPFPRRFLP